MIDLHTHTWYSDGTLSPTQLVHMAKEKGIDTLSITDHDGTFGLAEGKEAAESWGIHLVTGVEFSAFLPVAEAMGRKDAVYMHILGYDFDPHNKRLLTRIDEIRAQRKARNEKMLAVLKDLGYSLSKEDIEVYPGQDYIGKPNLARALVKHGYAQDVAEAFSSEKMMASPQMKAIHRAKIDAAEGISLIRDAGGFTSLAHPFKISYQGKHEDSSEVFENKLTQVLGRLIGLGLSGMECCYSGHSPKQERQLRALAEKYNLIVTAGSDYHGPGMKKDVELGGIHGS